MATKKTDNPEKVILGGKNAILLADACRLNLEKKAIEEKIAAIKVKMNLKKAGKYANAAGDELRLAAVETWTDIDPVKFYKELVARKLGNIFPSLVKINVAPAVKILGEDTVNKLRTQGDDSLRWTFK